MPPHIFVLLLEGKANLYYCGTVTIPSAKAMAQASPDIIDRFQAIEKVDLSGMDNLAGELRGPKATHKECTRTFPLALSPLTLLPLIHLPSLFPKAILTLLRTALLRH